MSTSTIVAIEVNYMTDETYWNHKGLYQTISEKLEKLVPDQGAVPNPRKNRALEKFRKASNCYYDLYNNGLCNRASEFTRVFGFSANKYSYTTVQYYAGRPRRHKKIGSMAYIRAEDIMNTIILKAAEEQGILDV